MKIGRLKTIRGAVIVSVGDLFDVNVSRLESGLKIRCLGWQ